MKIQASFKTYTGSPVSVFALFDDGAIAIVKISNTEKRHESIDVLISDDKSLNADFSFSDENISDAIQALFMIDKKNKLIMGDTVARANPKNAIEFDGVENSKRQYRIKNTIKNDQIATLAICGYIARYEIEEDRISLLDDLNNFEYDYEEKDDLAMIEALGFTI